MSKPALLLLVGVALFPSCGGSSSPTEPPLPQQQPPDPAIITQWEQQMVEKGHLSCDRLFDSHATFDEKLVGVYYDGISVYTQIGDYLRARDPSSDGYWRGCVSKAKEIYRDGYVLNAGCYGGGVGCVPGYWNFSTGLRLDFQKTGDGRSREAAVLLSRRAAYANDDSPLEYVTSAVRSREVAYAIRSYVDAERLGEPRRGRLAPLVDKALGHIDQWFVSKSYRCPADCDPQEAVGRYYIQPFMVGLTAEALIRYQELTGDSGILPALKTALDGIWDNAWVAADQSFWYDNFVPDPSVPFLAKPGAPSLNLLIAPAYAWVYTQTGEARYRDRADQVFAGGVKGAYLDGGKQFDQNYIWSFDYVSWRQQR